MGGLVTFDRAGRTKEPTTKLNLRGQDGRVFLQGFGLVLPDKRRPGHKVRKVTPACPDSKRPRRCSPKTLIPLRSELFGGSLLPSVLLDFLDRLPVTIHGAEAADS